VADEIYKQTSKKVIRPKGLNMLFMMYVVGVGIIVGVNGLKIIKNPDRRCNKKPRHEITPGSGHVLVVSRRANDKGGGGKACRSLCKHEYAIGRYGAGKRYDGAGCGRSVEVHLYYVVAGGEVDGTACPIVKFEGLVITTAFHILRDEEIGE